MTIKANRVTQVEYCEEASFNLPFDDKLLQYLNEKFDFFVMLDDDGIAVSTRSACASGSLRASHVLVSIGREYADAQGTMVITFGVDNTEEDVTKFLTALKEAVNTLREISPLYQKASN